MSQMTSATPTLASTDPTMASTLLWATAVVVSASFFAVMSVYVFFAV